MADYSTDLYADGVQVQHEALGSFGSGRLVGLNLVLTAGHVVRPDGWTDETDRAWSVRLQKDRPPGAEEWPFHKAAVVWVGEGGLDLALLKLTDEISLKPKYRTRIALVTQTAGHQVLGLGYPSGSKTAERKNHTVPPGKLRNENRPTLTFAIDPSYKPENPDDWCGFSGSAILHSVVRDERDIWIYGVAQQVPESFTGQLDIAPLVEALKSSAFRDLLEKAGVTDITPRDPSLLPPADDFPDIERLRKDAEHRLGVLEKGVLATELVLCETFDEIERLQLGSSETADRFNPDNLLDRFGTGKTVHVRAPGGLGKTFYFVRLALSAIDRGFVPFFLDVKGKSLSDEPSEHACETLFSAASKLGVNWQVFRQAKKEKFPVLIVVDSLNEAKNPSAILKTLQYLANNFSDNVFLIVADRMSGEQKDFIAVPATMLPLPLAVVAERLPDLNLEHFGKNFRTLLTIPFFLRLYEIVLSHAGSAPHTRADMLFAYVATSHDGSSQDLPTDRVVSRGKELAKSLSTIAFDAYARGNIRMEQSWLIPKLEAANIDFLKLVNAGMLIADEPDWMLFRHQLIHDFLAGCCLAWRDQQEELPHWRSANFEISTLKASSFDALDFAVELAGSDADELIIQIYDWSYSAAFNRIRDSEAHVSGSSPKVSNGLRDALIALDTEKQFDFFQHTREAAIRRADAINRVTESEFTKHKFRNLNELLEAVDQHYQLDKPPYSVWKRTFLLSRKAKVSELALLQASPIIAWTAANAFKRHIEKSDESVSYLLELYDALFGTQPLMDSAIGTRWRIVHILGAVDRSDVIEKLFASVKQEGEQEKTHWIQYGAVRSLVEIAGRQESQGPADGILARLNEMMGDQIRLGSHAFRQLREVAIIAEKSPPWWGKSYASILENGQRLAATPGEQEAWQKRLQLLIGG